MNTTVLKVDNNSEFAQSLIVAQAGNACKVLPCRSSEFPSKVTRPPYSVLDKAKLKTDFAYEVRHWRESLINS